MVDVPADVRWRDEQVKAMEAVHDAFAAGLSRVLVAHPTGARRHPAV
jgi:superfamily II DNA or RNA helicase